MSNIPRIMPTLLRKDHDISQFDCGKEPLNDFLKKFALQNQAGGRARTYIVTDAHESRVVAYYSLAPGSAVVDEVPGRVAKGQSRHPIPIILMARFAVDISEQGKGIGKSLFKDAMLRARHGAEIIGGRAFVVHAKDESAKAFYLNFEMEPSPTQPMHLFLLFKDIRE